MLLQRAGAAVVQAVNFAGALELQVMLCAGRKCAQADGGVWGCMRTWGWGRQPCEVPHPQGWDRCCRSGDFETWKTPSVWSPLKKLERRSKRAID